jgi:hypothetical protein
MGVAENIDKEKRRVFYVSPFTLKTTLVLDQQLADQGAFGVLKATYDANGNLITEGERKNGTWFLITNKYKKRFSKILV